MDYDVNRINCVGNDSNISKKIDFTVEIYNYGLYFD